METTKAADRIRARDRGLSLLDNMTAGIAFAAIAGVGVFGTLSALTIPGVSASSSGNAASTAAAASSSSSTTSSSSSDSSSASGLASSSGSVNSSSSTPVAVSGGS